MTKQKFPVALVKRACPLCAKVENAEILMKTRAVSENNNEFEDKLHGQTIGYLEKPCDNCRDMMNKGFLFIGIVGEKSEDIKNPYRSGNLWVVRFEAAQNIFGNHPDSEDILKKGAAFIDIKEAEIIGLPSPLTN